MEEILREDHNLKNDLSAMARLRGFLWALALFHVLVGIVGLLYIAPLIRPNLHKDFVTMLVSTFVMAAAYGSLAILHKRRPSEGVGWAAIGAEFAFTIVAYITIYMFFLNVLLPDSVVENGGGLMAGLIIYAPFVSLAIVLPLQAPAVRAPGRIKVRTLEPDDDNPWMQYSPVLAQLMVRVMNSDGKATKEEVRFFDQVLDEWHLIDLQKRLLREACDESTMQTSEIVARALKLGTQMGQADPARDLLVRLVATAKADGSVNPEEKSFLEHIARQAGLAPSDLDRLLAG